MNPDAGARVVSPKVRLIERPLGAHVTAAAPLGGAGFVLATGDGRVHRLGADGAVSSIALGAMALCAAPFHGAVALGCDDGRVVAVADAGEPQAIADLGGGWVDQIAASPATGALAFAAGRTLVVIGRDGAEGLRTDDHPSSVSGLSFAPDGAGLAASHYDGVTLHDLAGGGAARRLVWKGSHHHARWSPDGRFIATAMQDKELHLWRTPDGADIRMSGYPAKIRALCWSADARHLIASGADSVTCWPCDGPGPSKRPPLEFGYVFNSVATQVAAHPARSVAAAGYDDGTVLIGAIEKGEAAIARPGARAPVSAIAWDAAGAVVCAGCADGAVALAVMKEAVA